MIEQIVDPSRSVPFLPNENLLEERDGRVRKKHLSIIAVCASAGISIGGFIGILTIDNEVGRFVGEAVSFLGGMSTITCGIIASDAYENLSIVNETIDRRNTYRHPDDQLA